MSKDYVTKKKKSNIEDVLDKSLGEKVVSIGWDVSVHSTGVAVMRTTGHYLILEDTRVIKTPKGTKQNPVSYIEDFRIFIDQVDDFKRDIIPNLSPKANVIEQCFYQQNAKTLIKLAKFQGVVFDRFHKLVDYINFKGVSHVRSVTGFNKYKNKDRDLKEQIVEYVNEALGIEVESHDIADAILLAFYGLIKIAQRQE